MLNGGKDIPPDDLAEQVTTFMATLSESQRIVFMLLEKEVVDWFTDLLASEN